MEKSHSVVPISEMGNFSSVWIHGLLGPLSPLFCIVCKMQSYINFHGRGKEKLGLEALDFSLFDWFWEWDFNIIYNWILFGVFLDYYSLFQRIALLMIMLICEMVVNILGWFCVGHYFF